MSPVTLLYKVFHKNFEMPLPKKGVKHSLYTSLGLIAVFCIMLPCCIITGYLSYVMSLAMMVEGGSAGGIISELHIIAAFSMVLGMPVIFNVLFFSADREHLSTLPIKSWQLLAARFRHTFVAESVMEFLLLFSIFCGFFVAAFENGGAAQALHPVSLVAAIIGTATTPLLPLVYCSVLSLILMAVLKKVRSAKTFYLSSTVLLIFFIALFVFAFKDMGGITMENYVSSMADESNLFLRICNVIFFTTPLLCRAVSDHSLSMLLLYCAGNIAALALMLFLGRFLYREGLYTAAALGGSKKSSSRELLNRKLKQSSAPLSCFCKECRILLRTRAYASNCVFINFLWPVGLLVFFHITEENETIQSFLNYCREGNERARLILFMVMILISFIAPAMNSLAATAFTREGSHVDMVNYIPLSHRTQLLVKGAVSVLLTAPFLILSVIVLAVCTALPLLDVFLYCFLSLAALILVTILGLGLDSASPHTLWSDEYSALRGNLNSFFNMAAMLVTGLLFGGLAFLLYELAGLPLSLVRLIILILLPLLDLLAWLKGRKLIAANMENLF
ncbi:MAG: hypothetical protein IKO11_04345 [Lachnospiraceae bacterium]|nr:hypothetical protein [Lachnospiraceae bacterium]